MRVYTDGSCRNNGKPNAEAGVGVYFGKDHPGNKHAKVPGKQTNQRAELYAIQVALESAIEQEYKGELEICTDSQYSVNIMVDWWIKWQDEGKTDYKHKDIIDRIKEELETRFTQVTYRWVPRKENKEADQLSRAPKAEPEPKSSKRKRVEIDLSKLDMEKPWPQGPGIQAEEEPPAWDANLKQEFSQIDWTKNVVPVAGDHPAAAGAAEIAWDEFLNLDSFSEGPPKKIAKGTPDVPSAKADTPDE
jgi:ribonuclease HI